jgi:mannose-6-phosphate isomerase-like protein (cupin superfamily)
MKVHKRFKHPLSEKIGFWGERGGIGLRINFGKLASGEEFPKDDLHYHKTRTTYFCVLEGEMFVEVEGEIIQVTKENMLEVSPGEKYKTVSVGQEGCCWVVVGSHNKDDKVLL